LGLAWRCLILDIDNLRGENEMIKRILVIFLIITGAYIAMNYLFEGNGVNFSKGEDSAKVSNDIENISIDISSVRTAIIPEDRDDIRAELKGKGTVSVDKNGDDIEVTVKRKGFFSFNWFEQNKTSLTIYIPEDYDKNMEIELGSGEIVFKGASIENPMKLKSLALDIGSGSMELKNMDVETFDHNSSSGEVEINSLTAETGTFNVSSGSVKVQDFSGKLDAEVSSGELEIQMDELKDAISLNVSSGDIELDLPDNADFTLNGKISSGDISTDFQLKNKQETDNRLSGEHGNGKHEIDVDVSSGDIEIF
jgi:lia operon protein LiaG